MFHPIPQTTTVIIHLLMNGVACENTLHFKWNNTTPPTAGELLALCQEIHGTVVLKMANMTHNGCTYKDVYARNQHTEFAEQATYVPVTPYVGARPNYKIPNQVAKSITSRTGLTGRSNHGAFRMSGWDGPEIDRDTITTTLSAYIASLILSLIASRVSGRFSPAVASITRAVSTLITSWLIPHIQVGSLDDRTQKAT